MKHTHEMELTKQELVTSSRATGRAICMLNGCTATATHLLQYHAFGVRHTILACEPCVDLSVKNQKLTSSTLTQEVSHGSHSQQLAAGNDELRHAQQQTAEENQ